ncbi:MAG: peptidyl-prolyl cis-trans isomerase [Verrucomicrobiae bacterium]|nr:peptidyl-prolyl cis-trans isomerase [Verrucomicrobiae bacterium]MDW8308929.1 peptidyl-prolyl cis-trans isomerase [Verrucomicrobiales bacterium]
MIGTIRKHSTWLWAVIILATVVAFVIYFSPRQPDLTGRSTPNFGRIYGRPITRDDYLDAQREAELQFFFRYGTWPEAEARRLGYDIERETYFRLLLIRKLEDLGIRVGPEAVARVAANLLRSMSRNEPLSLDQFVKHVLHRRGMDAEDFERFIRHDLGIQQLAAVAGLSGRLVTPEEARMLYEREHTRALTEAAVFSASNYLAEVTVTPDAVAQFFTNQMARYRLPERVQIKYVLFPATNYWAEAEKQFAAITNFNEQVEAVWRALGTNFFRDARTPEEGRQRAREWMLRTNALTRAHLAATEFARAVFDLEPMRAENLDKVATEKGLAVRVSKPFARDFGPDDLPVGPEFTRAAFALSAEEPLAGPFVGEDGAYVIALDRRLPSEIPSFDTLRETVTADYRFDEARKRALAAAEKFWSTATNAMAAGKPFAQLCREANLTPQELPPVALSTQELPGVESLVTLTELKRAAFTTPPGRISGIVPTRDGALVLFVRERRPPEPDRINAELPAFTRAVRDTRQNEAFNDWFRKEAEKGLRETPLLQRPPTGAPGPG